MSRKAGSRLERPFQDVVIKFLKARKVWHFRYTASTTFGIPDIVCLYKGVFIGLELKRPDGEGLASGLQKAMIHSINKNGGIAKVIENLDEVVEIFEQIDAGIRPETISKEDS